MAKLNDTDRRILKLLKQKISKERIARRIGRPNDLARIDQAIENEKKGDTLPQEFDALFKPKFNFEK